MLFLSLLTSPHFTPTFPTTKVLTLVDTSLTHATAPVQPSVLKLYATLYALFLPWTTFHSTTNIIYKCTGLPWVPEWHPLMPIFFLLNWRLTALSRAPGPHQPHTWWRYIDDILMIWAHSVDDLHTFTAFLNNIHPTIKFTSNYSFTSIPFLDVKVSLSNGKITTDLYTKPTDKHQYLLHSSCHPKHTKRAIPFSLALRLRRICSSNETFTLRTNELNWHILTNVDITYLSLTKK